MQARRGKRGKTRRVRKKIRRGGGTEARKATPTGSVGPTSVMGWEGNEGRGPSVVNEQ